MQIPLVGIGWRQPHYRELMDRRPALGFLEVHAENFFADGGAAPAVLDAARAYYPLSLHGVGLGLGSALGLDEDHLTRLARLVDRVQPLLVSDHACFARAALDGQAVHGNDLLPIAFTPASLDILADNVQRVQDRLRRRLLVENLTQYLRWADDVLSEPAFFNELARRTGCGLLLDLNNLVVNALNAGLEPVAAATAWVDQVAPDAVAQIHLAGHRVTPDRVVDDHGDRVPASVWAVYRHALQRLGVRPILIEWDTDLPPLAVLLDEAGQAARIAAAARVR